MCINIQWGLNGAICLMEIHLEVNKLNTTNSTNYRKVSGIK